jgi:hypothetical protein
VSHGPAGEDDEAERARRDHRQGEEHGERGPDEAAAGTQQIQRAGIEASQVIDEQQRPAAIPDVVGRIGEDDEGTDIGDRDQNEQDRQLEDDRGAGGVSDGYRSVPSASRFM